MPITLSQARQNAINRRLNAVKQSAASANGNLAQFDAQTSMQTENPQNNGGFFGGVGYTLGKAGTGLLRGLEGIWDFVAGGIADLFGADEWAQEQMENSPFDKWNEELDAWYNPNGVMEFVGDVAGGVGQMLPSIAVTAATGGAGAPVATGMFMTSAAGQSVSDAVRESGELGGKEWLYGTASGAVEGAIEGISGGIGGTRLGTVLGKQVAKNTAGKLATSFVGEGLEEVASDLIDPALRRVTGVDPDATVDVSQLPNTFLVGGTAGAVLGGGSRLVNARRAGGFNNLNAAEDANAIREARARGNTLQAEGRLTDKWADTLSKSEQEAAQRLSTRLQRMNADTRAQFIEQNNLGDLYDANGVLAENTVAEPQGYNHDAISYSARNLVGRTDANGNSVLKYAPTQNAVREDIAQAAKDIAKLSNGNSRYVVVDTLTVPESGQKANAFYDDETGIMYIANDADASDARSFVVSHEYVHSLEGSGQYSRYANEVLLEIAQSPEYRKKYNYDEYYARYKRAHPNVQEETLNYIVETEMVADFTAKEILTNESAIRRLANRDASLVRRIYEWVKEKIRQLSTSGGSRESVAYLRKAERLLAKAMDNPGGGIGVNEMDKYVREEKARRDTKEKDTEAETAEAGEARRLADVRMSVQNVDKIKGTSTARAVGTATGSNSASDGDVSTNSVRDNTEKVNRKGQNSDKNKRYSLTIDGETVSGTVEETNDLVALHNLTEEKLLKVLDLGGFPMPSIAVTKPSLAHDNFGDITVVFGRGTIDPQRDSRNKVFSRDAWTPTTPRVEYKLNEKRAEEINRKINSLIRGTDAELFGYLALDESNMTEFLNRNGGDLAQSYRDKDAFKYAYLRDKGIEVTLPTVDKEVSDYGNTTIKWVADNLGKSTLNSLEQSNYSNEAVQPYVAQVNELVSDYWQREYNMSPNNEIDLYEVKGILREAARYADRGFPKSLDERAAREVINEHLDESAYNAWIDELFSDVVEKAGLRNNRDMYTSAGRSRSFEALHDDYTLENVVRAMSKADPKGGSWLGLNPSSLAAKLSKEFKSISDMKKAAASLTEVSDDAMSNFTTTAGQMLDEITADMVTREDYGSNFSYWNALDGAREVIGEIADRKLFTEKAIADYMKREYSGFYKYNADIGNKILGLFAYAKQMTQTGYFEAKPRRAVGFEEILRVLLPAGTNKRVTDALDKKHIPYEFYKEDESRSSIIQKMRDVRFSLPETDSDGNKLTAEQREFFENSKIRDADGKLLKMYHGTGADFTVFDLAESGASNDHTSHIGFWFTPRKSVAENFAEYNANDYQGKKARVQEVYLNIVNPKIYAPVDNSARMEELRTENDRLREQLAENHAELKETVGRLNYMLYFTDDNVFGRRGENDIGFRVDEDYYVQYMKMSPEQAKKVKSLVDAIKDGNKQIKRNETEYYRLHDDDSFLQMSDDLDEFMEWITGNHAHERGFGREHYAATNAREAAEKFRNKLIKEGYDGIWIKDTRVDDSGDQVVAFSPEQIKLTSNKKPTNNPDIRYSLSAIDDYTEKQYNDYGWVRVNDVLSDREYADFNRKMNNLSAEIRRGKTASGEYIIPVNDMKGERFGVDNVLVFAKGTYQNPKVTRVIRIDFEDKTYNNETNLTILREYIYEQERQDNEYASIIEDVYPQAIISRYTKENIPSYQESKIEWRRRSSGNESGGIDGTDREVQDGRGDSRSDQRDVRYSVSQSRDDNYVTNRLKNYTYSDVDKIVENLTIDKYGDDVVLRHKKNIGKQIYSMLNEVAPRNRKAEAEKIARRIVYQELATESLLNAEEIENARRDGIEISETWIDKKLSSQLSTTENEAFVRELRDELLQAFETTGKLNDTGRMYLRYKDMEDRLRTVVAKEKVLKTARKLKAKNYPLAFDGFDGVKKALSKIEYRSDINKSSTREIVAAFGQFYTPQNEALDGYYSNEVREAIDNFLSYNGEGNLDLYELEQLDTILIAADHLLRSYDKAFLGDRTVSVTNTAQKEIAVVKENAPEYGYTPLGRKGILGSALRSIVDMRTLMRWVDGGNSGIMTELFEQLAHGSTVQTITVMDLNEPFEAFIKENKKFYKELDKNITFKFNGVEAEITRAEAISLYLTSLQEDGLYHLAFGGFTVGTGADLRRKYNGKKPFYGDQSDVEAYEAEALREIKADITALYEQFNAAEKEYIRIARDLFNNKAKRIKQDVDMKRMGITNARVENYFPMRVYERGSGAQKPAQGFIQELNLIANQSIHKDRVKGSKQTLMITPVNMVIMNHIRQIAMYNAYAVPLDTFRRILNKNVAVLPDGKLNTAQAVTLKTTIQENAWGDFAKFIERFEMDVQGANIDVSTFDKVFRWIRSNYAKFQLGLNIKTMASQLTSLPMVGGRVGWGNLLKGTFAKVNLKEMFEYSEWARARAYEGAAYKSQALVDNLDTIGQLAMKPIGWVDMFTMNRIYNAAKYYVASRDHLSLDSVECKTKAAKLLEELGRETQNNSEVAERSAIMRSRNEIVKSIVMFSSDAMKQFSTLVQALNKISFIKRKLKRGIGDKAMLEKELKTARREARQAFASVATSMTFYVLMGMLINYGLFAKEPEDDETMVSIFLENLGGSVTGMIPLVRELYSFFVEGYELDNFAYDTFNGLTSAVKNVFDLFARAGSGERVTNQEWMLAMRKFIYAAGQVTGLPTRNIYNAMYGLIKRFSPSAAYEINSLFYGASTGDLSKAIEKGDEKLANTITQQLLADKGIDVSESVAEVFADLYEQGYSLPKGIPESFTYNDEEYILNAKQSGVLLDAYATASEKAEGLVNSEDFAKLSDDEKANALKLLFNYYYYAGLNQATGAYGDNRTLLLGEAIDISKIAVAYGQLSELKADTDREGNAISGTKKAKVQRLVNSMRLTAAQKYILMGFLGYKNANGENTVKNYVRSLGLSEEGQLALLEMCGYDTK